MLEYIPWVSQNLYIHVRIHTLGESDFYTHVRIHTLGESDFYTHVRIHTLGESDFYVHVRLRIKSFRTTSHLSAFFN